MARYIIRFHTNPAAWSTDPSEVAATWEAVINGGLALLASGAVAEINLTSGLAGLR